MEIMLTLGLIEAVWPDLEKFCPFGNIEKTMVNFVRVYLVGKMLNLLWHFFYAIGSSFDVVNGQILYK